MRERAAYAARRVVYCAYGTSLLGLLRLRRARE